MSLSRVLSPRFSLMFPRSLFLAAFSLSLSSFLISPLSSQISSLNMQYKRQVDTGQRAMASLSLEVDAALAALEAEYYASRVISLSFSLSLLSLSFALWIRLLVFASLCTVLRG